MMFGGSLAGMVFLSLIGDYLGRKSLLMISQLVSIIGYGLVLFATSIWLAGVGLFLCMTGCRMTLVLGYVYVS